MGLLPLLKAFSHLMLRVAESFYPCAGRLLAEGGTKEAGRPRANRAEDWSAQPPAEGCWGLEPFREAVAVAAAVEFDELQSVFAGSSARGFSFELLGGDLAAVGWVVDPRPNQADLPQGHPRRIRTQVSID